MREASYELQYRVEEPLQTTRTKEYRPWIRVTAFKGSFPWNTLDDCIENEPALLALKK